MTTTLTLIGNPKSKIENPKYLALLVALLYLLLAALMLFRAGDFQPDLQRWPNQFFIFVHPGRNWDPQMARPVNTEDIGYDGQFYYDLSRWLFDPPTRLDKPSYRAGRILYPLVARGLALGQPALLPITLLLVNLVAVVGTVYMLAALLARLKRPPALALLYAFWPGTLCAYLYDLSEPLCFAFIALALWLHFGRNEKQPSPAIRLGLLFLLASLTKELGLLFGGGWLLYYLARRQWRAAFWLALSWLGPFALWQLFLVGRFGRDGLSAGQPFAWFPFGGWFGAASYHPPIIERVALLAATVVPLLWSGWLLWRTWQRNRPAWQELQANPLLYAWISHAAFLLFLPAASFIYLLDHARNLIGELLVLLLLPLPYISRLHRYLLITCLILDGLVLGFMLTTSNAFLYSFGF